MPNPYTKIALLMRPDSGFYRGVLRGIKAYADQQRAWVFGMTAATKDVPLMLRTWQPAGILAFIYIDERFRLLERLDTPVVSFANVDASLRLPTVTVDDVAVGAMAAEHLLERGFQHFAFVGFPRYHYSNQRQAGFTQTLDQAGFTCRIFHDRHSPDAASVWAWTAEPTIQEWLVALPRPIGMFTANDAVALRLSEFCRQNGLRVPEDVALLGVDDDDLFCRLAHPQLSSVKTPLDRIGYEAARLLDQLMAGRPTPDGPLLVPPMYVVTRQSTDIQVLDDPDLAQVIRYIHNNAHRPFGIDQVLREIPLSRRSLERKCRTALKRSPLQELLRVRLRLAQNLLSETQLSIAAIAQKTGFVTGKQLCTIFHKKLGMTPTAYRQQFRLSH